MKVLILVLALAVTLQCQIAAATSLYVRSDSSTTTWPCGTSIATACKSIATAVNNAPSTTIIKVARGDYVESFVIADSKQLAIEGGWNADFTIQSPDPSLTQVTPSGNNAIVSISLGAWENVDLRLSALTFRGVTNLQRFGIQASGDNSIIDLTVEHCRVESFRGQGLSIYGDNISDINISVTETIFQGNFQYPSNEPWPALECLLLRGMVLQLT
jgi:hypothetical protein